MFKRWITKRLRNVLELLGDEDPRKMLSEIKDNHLVHIYTRLGNLEGRVSLIIGLMTTTVVLLIGQQLA